MYFFKVIILSCISRCLVAEVIVNSNITVFDTPIVDNSSLIVVDVTSSIHSSLSYTHNDTNSTTTYSSGTASSSIVPTLAIASTNPDLFTEFATSQLYLNNTANVPLSINQSAPWSQAEDSSLSTAISQTAVIPAGALQIDLTSYSFPFATSSDDAAISWSAATAGNISTTPSTLIDQDTNVSSTSSNVSSAFDLSSFIESSFISVPPDIQISNTSSLHSETILLYNTSVGETTNTAISDTSVVYSETSVSLSTTLGAHVTTSTSGEESSFFETSSWIDPSSTDEPSSAWTIPFTSHLQTTVYDTSTVTLYTSYIEPEQTTESVKSATTVTQSSTQSSDILSTMSPSSVVPSTTALDVDILNGKIAALESDVTAFRSATIVLAVLVVVIVGGIVGIVLYSRYRPNRRNPYLDDEDQATIRRPKVRLSMDNLKSLLFPHSTPVEDDGDSGRDNTTFASFKTDEKKGKSTSVVVQMKEKLDTKTDSHMYGKHEKMTFETADIPETKDENLSNAVHDNAGYSSAPDRLSEVDLSTD